MEPSRQFLTIGALLVFAIVATCLVLFTIDSRRYKSRDPVGLDLAGNTVDPLAAPGPVTVLVFLDTECPIANRFAPEVRRIHDLFQDRGVKFWLVYADPARSTDAVQKHLDAYRFGCPALRDTEQGLARFTGARVTPEAVVFNADRNIVYRGRINDQYVDFGKTRPAPTRHDLIDAIEATLQGERVAEAVTEAIGCFIPGLEE